MLIHELTASECRKELLGGGLGRLACSRENQPYVVPLYFAFDGEDIYAFSMLGQKIEWMRTNPLVCLEIDRVESTRDWTCVIVMGRYEEIDESDDPDARRHAHELLQRRAMWWEPGALPTDRHRDEANAIPIFFRITIDRLSGRRAVAGT